jgi:hypothetical protein
MAKKRQAAGEYEGAVHRGRPPPASGRSPDTTSRMSAPSVAPEFVIGNQYAASGAPDAKLLLGDQPVDRPKAESKTQGRVFAAELKF